MKEAFSSSSQHHIDANFFLPSFPLIMSVFECWKHLFPPPPLLPNFPWGERKESIDPGKRVCVCALCAKVMVGRSIETKCEGHTSFGGASRKRKYGGALFLLLFRGFIERNRLQEREKADTELIIVRGDSRYCNLWHAFVRWFERVSGHFFFLRTRGEDLVQ